MIGEIGKPACKAGGKMEHSVEALNALPEHAPGTVAVRLELDSGLALQLPPHR
jgi:hypothetical protein